MPEPEVIPEPRENKKLTERINELERCVKLLMQATVAIEDQLEEYTIPKGTYCGYSVE